MAVEVTQRKIDALPSLRTIFDDGAENTRGKVLGIYGVLLVFNRAAWLWAILAFRHFPVLLGTAFLAYSFGLRHAVDADHIAAIDHRDWGARHLRYRSIQRAAGVVDPDISRSFCRRHVPHRYNG
jgi:hypothetical protein